MGCCGSKNKKPELANNSNQNDGTKSQIKFSGSNNIRLPAPLASPYPHDQIDVQKYLGDYCEEKPIYEPDRELVPQDLQMHQKIAA